LVDGQRQGFTEQILRAIYHGIILHL
jgi:hypothetical protein